MPAPDLPEVHPDNAAAWASIEASTLGDRMKRALRRVAVGEPFSDAAKADGYGTHSGIYRYVKRYGLKIVSGEHLVEGCKRVARMGLDELEKRPSGDPDGLSMKELGVTTGIMLDKVAKYERWGLEPGEGGGAASALEMIVEAVWEGKLEFELKVTPHDPAEDAVDVTTAPGEP